MGSVILSEAVIHIQCGFACGQVETEGSISCLCIQEYQHFFFGGAENGLDEIPSIHANSYSREFSHSTSGCWG